MKQLLRLLVFIFLLLAFKDSYSQLKDDYSAKIDSLIQTTSPRSFNGVILITQHGQTKYAKALGYADIDNKIPLTIKDNFRIQSNSNKLRLY